MSIRGVAVVRVAVVPGVGPERSGRCLGVCPSAVPVGAGHAPSLTYISQILETQETSRPAAVPGKHTQTHIHTLTPNTLTRY